MKQFLILQLRPETEASDDEFRSFLEKGGLRMEDVERIRLDETPLPDDIDLESYAGIIVGGGPGCISDPKEKKNKIEARIEETILDAMEEIVEKDIPFLGCCYGIGILAHHLGARVSKERYGEEVGPVRVSLTHEGEMDPLTKDLPKEFDAFVGHKEAVQELPHDCVQLITSEPCPYQMIRCGQNVYATQFHPEADNKGFEVRINIYKHKGYFKPEDAQAVIDRCNAADVHVPEEILTNFVKRYR